MDDDKFVGVVVAVVKVAGIEVAVGKDDEVQQ